MVFFFYFAGAANGALGGSAKDFNTGTIFSSQHVGSLGHLPFTLNI